MEEKAPSSPLPIHADIQILPRISPVRKCQIFVILPDFEFMIFGTLTFFSKDYVCLREKIHGDSIVDIWIKFLSK